MPRFAANLSMMYTELGFLDRFAAAAKDGFKAVEFLFPYDYPAAEIAARLRDCGLQQVLFNAPPGDWAAGERGITQQQLPGAADPIYPDWRVADQILVASAVERVIRRDNRFYRGSPHRPVQTPQSVGRFLAEEGRWLNRR